jgi:hypothetical protein
MVLGSVNVNVVLGSESEEVVQTVPVS